MVMQTATVLFSLAGSLSQPELITQVESTKYLELSATLQNSSNEKNFLCEMEPNLSTLEAIQQKKGCSKF